MHKLTNDINDGLIATRPTKTHYKEMDTRLSHNFKICILLAHLFGSVSLFLVGRGNHRKGAFSI